MKGSWSTLRPAQLPRAPGSNSHTSGRIICSVTPLERPRMFHSRRMRRALSTILTSSVKNFSAYLLNAWSSGLNHLHTHLSPARRPRVYLPTATYRNTPCANGLSSDSYLARADRRQRRPLGARQRWGRLPPVRTGRPRWSRRSCAPSDFVELDSCEQSTYNIATHRRRATTDACWREERCRSFVRSPLQGTVNAGAREMGRRGWSTPVCGVLPREAAACTPARRIGGDVGGVGGHWLARRHLVPAARAAGLPVGPSRNFRGDAASSRPCSAAGRCSIAPRAECVAAVRRLACVRPRLRHRRVGPAFSISHA
jgi:hypothetical protein